MLMQQDRQQFQPLHKESIIHEYHIHPIRGIFRRGPATASQVAGLNLLSLFLNTSSREHGANGTWNKVDMVCQVEGMVFLFLYFDLPYQRASRSYIAFFFVLFCFVFTSEKVEHGYYGVTPFRYTSTFISLYHRTPKFTFCLLFLFGRVENFWKY